MIPRTVPAPRPGDEPPVPRTDPDIIPLPGATRRADREPNAPPSGFETGPRDILNALRYHSVLFMTLGTLTAIAFGAGAWVLVPAKYTTYALVSVAQSTPIVVATPGNTANRGEFVTTIKTEASKILNTNNMIGALRDPKYGIAQLAMLRNESSPETFLEEHIKVETSDTNQFIKILLSGEDPVEITKIVHAVVDYYYNTEKSSKKEKAERIDVLTRRLNEYRKQRDELLRSYERDFGLKPEDNSLTPKQQGRLSRFLDLEKRKMELLASLAQARAEQKAVQEQLDQCDTMPVPMPELKDKMDRDPDIASKVFVVKRLEKSITEQETIGSAAEKRGPRYQYLVQQWHQAKAELEVLREKYRATLEANYRFNRRQELTLDAKRLQNTVRQWENVEQLTTQELAGLTEFDKNMVDRREADRLAQKDHWEQLRSEVIKYEGLVNSLNTELDAPDRVEFKYHPQIPTKPDMKKQMAVTGFASIFGLGLVGGCLSVYELRKKRVYGPKDQVFRRLTLIGCLPDCNLPAASASRTDGADPAGREFFEAVDKVKTVLCRQMQRRRMQALLVTSAVPGEGKSVLAWHLALSLARTDKRTLFIDGNLRNPGLHNHFDIASHPGLSELLRGERPIAEVVQRTALNNLWCIAAGVCDEQARQSLDKEALRKLLERARQEYDYVILDACSIREAVDPLYIAQQVDATVLSVRTFDSCTTDVERACQRLTMLGTPLLGAVLTDASGAGCEF